MLLPLRLDVRGHKSLERSSSDLGQSHVRHAQVQQEWQSERLVRRFGVNPEFLLLLWLP